MFLEPIPSGIRGTGSSLVRIMNRTRLIARSSVAEMNVRFSTGHMGPIHSVDFARRLASQDLLLHFPRRRSLPLSGMNSLGSLLFCFSDCISSLGSFLKLTCGPQHAAADAAGHYGSTDGNRMRNHRVASLFGQDLPLLDQRLADPLPSVPELALDPSFGCIDARVLSDVFGLGFDRANYRASGDSSLRHAFGSADDLIRDLIDRLRLSYRSVIQRPRDASERRGLVVYLLRQLG